MRAHHAMGELHFPSYYSRLLHNCRDKRDYILIAFVDDFEGLLGLYCSFLSQFTQLNIALLSMLFYFCCTAVACVSRIN